MGKRKLIDEEDIWGDRLDMYDQDLAREQNSHSSNFDDDSYDYPEDVNNYGDSEYSAGQERPRKRKMTWKNTTPRKATPKKNTPKKATPKKDTPKKATPKQATPKKATPKRATPMKATIEKSTPRKATTPKEPSEEVTQIAVESNKEISDKQGEEESRQKNIAEQEPVRDVAAAMENQELDTNADSDTTSVEE